MTVKEVFDNTLKQMESMKLTGCEATRVTMDSQPITETVNDVIPDVQMNRIKGYAFALRFSVMKWE